MEVRESKKESGLVLKYVLYFIVFLFLFCWAITSSAKAVDEVPVSESYSSFSTIGSDNVTVGEDYTYHPEDRLFVSGYTNDHDDYVVVASSTITLLNFSFANNNAESYLLYCGDSPVDEINSLLNFTNAFGVSRYLVQWSGEYHCSGRLYFAPQASGPFSVSYLPYDTRLASSSATSTSFIDFTSVNFGIAILIFLSSFTMWGFVFNSFDKKSYA